MKQKSFLCWWLRGRLHRGFLPHQGVRTVACSNLSSGAVAQFRSIPTLNCLCLNHLNVKLHEMFRYFQIVPATSQGYFSSMISGSFSTPVVSKRLRKKTGGAGLAIDIATTGGHCLLTPNLWNISDWKHLCSLPALKISQWAQQYFKYWKISLNCL